LWSTEGHGLVDCLYYWYDQELSNFEIRQIVGIDIKLAVVQLSYYSLGH